MPTIVIIVWQALGDSSATIVINTLSTSPLFNYKDAFNFQSTKFYHMLRTAMFFMIPELEPPIFQRISMGSNVNLVVKAFRYAGLICFLIQSIFNFSSNVLIVVVSFAGYNKTEQLICKALSSFTLHNPFIVSKVKVRLTVKYPLRLFIHFHRDLKDSFVLSISVLHYCKDN